MSDAPVRPPQVTVAGWLVVGGSVIVVLTAFSQVAQLSSLQTREAIEEYLSSPPGSSLGIGVQGALSVMRIAGMIAAACAAAAAILGWQALQRSKGARVALSALAAPLLITGMLGGGFASAIVVAAIVMLWFQPARDWFEGRSPQQVSKQVSKPVSVPEPEPVLTQMPQAVLPVSSGGVTAQHDPLLDLPPPSGPAVHLAVRDESRPRAVLVACSLAWAFSALVFAVLALTLITALADPDALVAELNRQNPDLVGQGVTHHVLRSAVIVIASVGMIWAAAAIAFAVFAFRQVRWAAAALMVSSGIAASLCLIVLVGSLLLVVPMIACGAVVFLMLRPEVRAWYSAGDSPAVRGWGG